MDPKFRSSFIPKKSITTKSAGPKTYRSFNVLTFATTILFVVSLAASIGMFLYERFIEDSIDKKGIELEKARQTINPSLLEEFKALDEKLRTAEELLGRHIAMTLFFEFLESSTLQNVQYNDFSYILDTAGNISIDMAGTARSFNAIALQSDIFRDSGMMLESRFTRLNLDDSGNVEFNVTSKLDPSFVLYRNVYSVDRDFGSFNTSEDIEPVNADEDFTSF